MDHNAPQQMMQEIAHQHLFNQFWLSLFFVIPMVLVARAAVAGTRYSAILIIVIFGLLMGYLLVLTGVSEPGLGDFPMLGMIAQSTIIALAASFFVGGQELRRIFSGRSLPPDGSVVYSTGEGCHRSHRPARSHLRSSFLPVNSDIVERLFSDESRIPKNFREFVK